ncbi:transcriptional regulator, LacI family [Kaistia soli DSM 19436]|uniref:Transcriptional regulator, LacI family n=1 Tax=Kaistia soli DSM 19436 TaxID=1122133 RepID=A0A1M5J3P5_9HYPH|nr:LacI family DNA-binding transcriptional regulator [Kaistia soli]SHG35151.1 transcriptional regulator, LacI family [Kaistia soli DSM 19436]
MTTLRDVARHAGVSIGSVSTVINNTAPVSPALRAKVLLAIDELGYVPDAVARSLKMGRTRTIGLILPDITNPHFAAIAGAIEIACDAAGYSLLLCNTMDNPTKELRDLRLMRTQRVDGVILVPGVGDGDYIGELNRAVSVPIVLIDRTLPGLDFDAVVLDNRAASHGLVDYFVRSGHRRIGIVIGPPGISIAKQRLEGYLQALADHDIDVEPAYIAHGGFQPEPDYHATAGLLALRRRPTAIMSTSYHTTIGVMKALLDKGFRCPNDISVAGIDDFVWATAFSPKMTVMAQPIADMARHAAQRLFGRISGAITGPAEVLVSPPTLLVRESTRPLVD